MANPKHSKASCEHYTPPEYADAIREFLGGIDLDPASNVVANKIVKSKAFYTKTTDGFNRQWLNEHNLPVTFFCNPPGDRPGSSKAWFFKAAQEWMQNRAKEGIFLAYSSELLQTAQVDTPFGLPLPQHFPRLVPARRIAFLRSYAEWTANLECQIEEGKITFVQAGKVREKILKMVEKLGVGSDLQEDVLIQASSPPHSNLIVYFPGGSTVGEMEARSLEFKKVFSKFGEVELPRSLPVRDRFLSLV